MEATQYNIFDLGFNKYLIKGSGALESTIEKLVDDLPMPSVMGSGFIEIPPSQIGSGEIGGNLTMIAGLLQSANYVSGSAGWAINYDGSAEFSDITLYGGTVKYGKTAFTDSTNAGYWIGALGFYMGGASDVTKLKYTVADGTLSFIGILQDSAGAAILNSSAKTILKGFTFSPDDYSGAFKSGDIAWNITTGEITGGSGIIIYKKGIIGAAAGVTTFSIDATTGNATFAGTLIAASGSLGSITTGLITLDNTGYIKGGQTDFNTSIGFFLGYSGAYKFSIGNPAANYLTWDGSTLDVTAARYMEPFQAGENIADGDIVCVKPSYTDFFPTDDAYTWEYTPDTNYGTAVTMFTGLDASQKNYLSWLKFSMVAVPAVQFILKATLRIKVYQIVGTPTAPEIQRVSSADWAEGTITYNNQPTATDDIKYYGSQDTAAIPALDEWLELDITDLVRNWKAGDLNNYGVLLKVSTPGTVNNLVQWHSSNAANAADRPVLRIYASNASDRKVYKADSSDYFLSRTIMGVAQEAIISGNTGKIQTHGKVNNIGATGSGSRVYLSNTPGGITSDTTNAYRVILLGKSIVAGTMVLNIQDQDIFISKPYSDYWAAYGAIKYYAPADARYVRVVGNWTDIYGTMTSQMDVYRGISEGNSRNLTVHHAGTTFSHINITWLANYVTITGSAGTSAKLYFYT